MWSVPMPGFLTSCNKSVSIPTYVFNYIVFHVWVCCCFGLKQKSFDTITLIKLQNRLLGLSKCCEKAWKPDLAIEYGSVRIWHLPSLYSANHWLKNTWLSGLFTLFIANLVLVFPIFQRSSSKIWTSGGQHQKGRGSRQTSHLTSQNQISIWQIWP